MVKGFGDKFPVKKVVKSLFFCMVILIALAITGSSVQAWSCSNNGAKPWFPPNIDGDNDGKVDDWLAQRDVDAAGNVDEVYCLDRRDNGDSCYYAKKYTPGGKDGKWVAKCNFPNAFNYKYIGKCKGKFSKIIWENIDKDSDNDYEYEYYPKRDKLIIYKTKHDKTGTSTKPPKITKTEKTYDGPAPKNLDDLKPENVTLAKPFEMNYTYMGEFEYCEEEVPAITPFSFLLALLSLLGLGAIAMRKMKR